MHPLENLAETRTDQDSGTGSNNAAELDLQPLRRGVDIHVDTSGDATLTVDVAAEGSNYRQLDTVSYSGASQEIEQYDIVWDRVRAHLNQNRNLVELSSKGVS